MATPTEADVNGPAAETSTPTCRRPRSPEETGSACSASSGTPARPAFAGRQALYEYYFFGDPVRMATAYQASYDKSPYADRVREFLDRP